MNSKLRFRYNSGGIKDIYMLSSIPLTFVFLTLVMLKLLQCNFVICRTSVDGILTSVIFGIYLGLELLAKILIIQLQTLKANGSL